MSVPRARIGVNELCSILTCRGGMIIGFWEVLRTIWEFPSRVATVLKLGNADGVRRAGLTSARKNMVEKDACSFGTGLDFLSFY